MWDQADGVHFLTLVHPIRRAYPQVNVRVSRRILCFQRWKLKKSEYIVHLFEFLREATGTGASS